jgi:ABC-type transporter Mla MlaB component
MNLQIKTDNSHLSILALMKKVCEYREKLNVEMKENGNNVQVDFSGDLDVHNAVSVVREILNNIRPSTKSVEFHFEKAGEIDVSGMVMIVVTAKNLRKQHITCRATGLTEDSLYLATVLGLGMMAELE